MKRIVKLLSAATAAIVLLATTGCNSIRDYSVNSYQGVLPMSYFLSSGTASTTLAPETAAQSVPTAPPAASTNAAASGSATK